jgi:hypothetical protein
MDGIGTGPVLTVMTMNCLLKRIDEHSVKIIMAKIIRTLQTNAAGGNRNRESTHPLALNNGIGILI